MFETIQEIEESLLNAGLSLESARSVAEHARPAIVITTEAVGSEEEIPLGATKIGGCPDLPAGMTWPVRPPYPNGAQIRDEHLKMAGKYPAFSWMPEEERERYRREALELADAAMREAPLAFIAQIDLAAVATVAALDADFPKEGRFLLFYDVKEQPWGFRLGDIVGARLIFDQTPVPALVRMPVPEDMAEMRMDPLRCTLAATLVCESPFSPTFDHLDDKDMLFQWSDDLEPLGSTHRVGGYPTQIQGDMACECVLLSQGIDLGSSPEPLDEIELEPERQNWVFLFQIASDDNNGMMWGDSGMLYLWIHRCDLKARRFENARPILQCG
ncbi:hypothetical protein DC522_14390 [Microvirga sp. KLBC 81]|uniref:YwqG family protein n=1 Tax=Microvirga sp. KLBC 81 TaxID=1862707 RepID=UPI000D513BDB|nr:YwqG family protein [Microvirga sp. KLBC 81]PVE23638.1 hypothetical protein DC522_14390 [Microvirga sp. KLBC 81]